jgi:glutamine synthetase
MATNSNKSATPKSVMDMARKSGAKMVDIKFVDTFGTWQHFSCPIDELNDEVFAEGFGFDGSSIRGWKSIEASDMLRDARPGHRLHGSLLRRARRSPSPAPSPRRHQEAYTRDPRGIAHGPSSIWFNRRGRHGVFRTDAEFFIFETSSSTPRATDCFYTRGQRRGGVDSGRDEMPNLGNKIRQKEGISGWPRRTRSRTSARRCAVDGAVGVRRAPAPRGGDGRGQARSITASTR